MSWRGQEHGARVVTYETARTLAALALVLAIRGFAGGATASEDSVTFEGGRPSLSENPNQNGPIPEPRSPWWPPKWWPEWLKIVSSCDPLAFLECREKKML